MFRGKKIQYKGGVLRFAVSASVTTPPETPKVPDPKIKRKKTYAPSHIYAPISRKIYGICSSHARSARSFRRENGDISWIFQEYFTFPECDLDSQLCPKTSRWGGGGVVCTIPCRPRWPRRVHEPFSKASSDSM